MTFFKVVPRPLGMLKQAFLAHLEPVVTRFGPWKFPKCLENGPFQEQKWVTNGSKTRFSKSDPRPFGMLGQVFLAHFEPIRTALGPWKSQYSLKRGRFGSKNGCSWSKTRFSRSDPAPLGAKMGEVGQKRVFPEVILHHWGCTNKCFQPILSPF